MIVYQVVEDEIEYFTTTQEGLNFTNSYQSPLTTITATKTWEGGPSEDHVEVELILQRQIEGGPIETVNKLPMVSTLSTHFEYT